MLGRGAASGWILLAAAALACVPSGRTSILGATVHTLEVESDTFHVDRIYRSMQGPEQVAPLSIAAGGAAEPIWIVGLEMTAVDLAGRELDYQDNLCHAQLRSGYTGEQWERYNRTVFQGTRVIPEKWFTLIAGQQAIDFPSGFGIPAMSGEPLSAQFMILNQDPDLAPFDMRVRMRVRFVYERELERPMTALSKAGFTALAYKDEIEAPPGGAAADCALLPQEIAGVPNAQTPSGYTRIGEREAAYHWMVPPGRHVYRNLYTLSDPATVHYIAAHLHIYGESIEVRDAATGATVFKSIATPNAKHTAVQEMTHFSSAEGLELRPGDYELVTVYDNPTEQAIDAMGVVYLYVANPSFRPS